MTLTPRTALIAAVAAFAVVLAGCSSDESTVAPDVDENVDETADADAEAESDETDVVAEPDVEDFVALDADDTYDAFFDATAAFYAGDAVALDGLASTEVIGQFAAQTDGRVVAGVRDSEVVETDEDGSTVVVTDCIDDRRFFIDEADYDGADLDGMERPGRTVWATVTTTLEQVDGVWTVVGHVDPMDAALSSENDIYADIGPQGYNDCVRVSAVDEAVDVANRFIVATFDMSSDNDASHVEPYAGPEMYEGMLAINMGRIDDGNVTTENESRWEIMVAEITAEVITMVRCQTHDTWIVTRGDEVINDSSGGTQQRTMVVDRVRHDTPRVVAQQDQEGEVCADVTELPFSYPER